MANQLFWVSDNLLCMKFCTPSYKEQLYYHVSNGLFKTFHVLRVHNYASHANVSLCIVLVAFHWAPGHIAFAPNLYSSSCRNLTITLKYIMCSKICYRIVCDIYFTRCLGQFLSFIYFNKRLMLVVGSCSFLVFRNMTSVSIKTEQNLATLPMHKESI